MPLDEHDARESYCRQLGHAVPFSYCRQVNGGLPCRLTTDCWHGQFDVMTWLCEHHTPEELAKIFAPPKPKMTTIVELIQNLQKGADLPPGT